MTLGMVTGEYFKREMQDAFAARGVIDRAQTIAGLMRMLVEGRGDLVAADLRVGRHTVALHAWEGQVDMVKRPIAVRRSHFGLSKKTGVDRFVTVFDRAIDELVETGVIDGP